MHYSGVFRVFEIKTKSVVGVCPARRGREEAGGEGNECGGSVNEQRSEEDSSQPCVGHNSHEHVTIQAPVTSASLATRRIATPTSKTHFVCASCRPTPKKRTTKLVEECSQVAVSYAYVFYEEIDYPWTVSNCAV